MDGLITLLIFGWLIFSFFGKASRRNKRPPTEQRSARQTGALETADPEQSAPSSRAAMVEQQRQRAQAYRTQRAAESRRAAEQQSQDERIQEARRKEAEKELRRAERQAAADARHAAEPEHPWEVVSAAEAAPAPTPQSTRQWQAQWVMPGAEVGQATPAKPKTRTALKAKTAPAVPPAPSAAAPLSVIRRAEERPVLDSLRFNDEQLRLGVVMAEILGPCKAQQRARRS